MPRRGLFGAAGGRPLAVGFEEIEQLLDRVAAVAGEAYPPFNLELHGEDRYRLSLAVAGFAADELEITAEDGRLLVVRGAPRPEDGRVFLHRGVAARKFQRAFVLADGVEALDARLVDGLLHIDLRRVARRAAARRLEIGG